MKNHFSGHITEHSSDTCVRIIEQALKTLLAGSYTREGYKFVVKEEKYEDKLKLEIEVCEVQQHNEKGETVIKNGISFKRTSGSVFHYKELVHSLTSEMDEVLK